MRVLLTGATGMVGQGVLRECLLTPFISMVVVVGRSSVYEQLPDRPNPKLHEILLPDLGDLTGHEAELTGFDACFFCAGVSSVGMSEAKYTALTYDLTLRFARTLAPLNPQMTFFYVSGAGTDSSEKSRTMWARVKGRTENALLHLPFKAAFLFRPGYIQPLHGVRSKTPVYQLIYNVVAPLTLLLKDRLPKYITTTEQIGRAMIHVAKAGYPKPILDPEDINSL
jgi:uncharacterized protein YbjT (DUF2867 family)